MTVIRTPRLKIGGLYFVKPNHEAVRLPIKGFIAGYPVKIDKTTFVYVSAKEAKRVIG